MMNLTKGDYESITLAIQQKDQKIVELQARVAELSEFIKDAEHYCDSYYQDAYFKDLEEILNRTPKQSLNRVRAEALREVAEAMIDEDYAKVFDKEQRRWLMAEANRLEQGEG